MLDTVTGHALIEYPALVQDWGNYARTSLPQAHTATQAPAENYTDNVEVYANQGVVKFYDSPMPTPLVKAHCLAMPYRTLYM